MEQKEILMKLHGSLLDDKKTVNLVSDTGTMEEGWVVYTVSCEKKDLIKKLKHLEDSHKNSYPVKNEKINLQM